MREFVVQFSESQHMDRMEALSALVEKIRPNDPDNSFYASQRIRDIILVLKEDRSLCDKFRSNIVDIVVLSKQSELYTQVNLISRGTFFSEIKKRIFRKLLPVEPDLSTLRGIINKIFYKRNDHVWLNGIPDELYAEFIEVLGIKHPSQLHTEDQVVDELLNDVYILSQVICSLSIDQNIIKNFDHVLDKDSPFMKLHESVDAYIEALESNKISKSREELLYRNVVASIDECTCFVNEIKESKSRYGTSLALTIVLQKLNLSLKRLDELLRLMVTNSEVEQYASLFRLFKKLVKIENEKNSIGVYFNDTISLLAFQITEHTGRIGEHYVTNNAKEYFEMFINALKGGLVVGFLVVFKFLINGLHLPLLQDTILKALNYSFGFIGIQLSHGTLATKQPSMTASTIAKAIESQTEENEVKEIGNFIITVFRSQFIAVVGNIALALPVSFAINYIWMVVTGDSLVSNSKAISKINELDPFSTLCVLHGAIAGIMLFASGTIAGIAENSNIFNGYGNRIKNHPLLKKIFGRSISEKLGDYVNNNIGGLTGNFTLGFFLAFVSFFGSILGLNIDIQHVTFASGNLGFALSSTINSISWNEIIIPLTGIVLIGVVNILVSFSLALFVAIKARQIKLKKTGKVLIYLLRMFLRKPLAFFFPVQEKN